MVPNKCMVANLVFKTASKKSWWWGEESSLFGSAEMICIPRNFQHVLSYGSTVRVFEWRFLFTKPKLFVNKGALRSGLKRRDTMTLGKLFLFISWNIACITSHLCNTPTYKVPKMRPNIAQLWNERKFTEISTIYSWQDCQNKLNKFNELLKVHICEEFYNVLIKSQYQAVVLSTIENNSTTPNLLNEQLKTGSFRLNEVWANVMLCKNIFEVKDD